MAEGNNVEQQSQPAAQPPAGAQALGYQKRLCPILSLPSLSREPSRLVSVGGDGVEQRKGPSAEACQGPKCAWFVPITNENGQLVDGACAPTLIPAALNNFGQAIAIAMQAGKKRG